MTIKVYVDDRTIDSHIKRLRKKMRMVTMNSLPSRRFMVSAIVITKNNNGQSRWDADGPTA